MAKKEYYVRMVVKCEEGAQNYIAQSVCDGLEDETCVTYIKVEESIEGSEDLDNEMYNESI